MSASVCKADIALKQNVSGSMLFPRNKSNGPEDILFGSLLNEGSFCSILDIIAMKSYRIASSVEYEESNRLSDKRNNLKTNINSEREATNQNYNNTGLVQTDRCYVAKRLRSNLCSKDQTMGAIDLVAEAKLLTLLSHHNIIDILGTSGMPGDIGYCLIIERLGKTLPEKMREWNLITMRRSYLEGIFKNNVSLWNERLTVISEIGDALNYLHSIKIMHRDIKPSNISFDFKGVVKVIDFGFAKELKPIHRIGPDKYRSSKNIGTRRYMAPEVALSDAYGTPADVFSFTILIWEILTLKNAFCNVKSVDEHEQYVYIRKKRPIVPSCWSKEMKKIMANCWAHNPSDRLRVSQICDIVKHKHLKV